MERNGKWREMGRNWVVRVRERKRRESGVYDSDEERDPPCTSDLKTEELRNRG